MITGDCIADIGIVALTGKNGVLTAAFKCFWRILFSTAQDAKAVSKRLHRVPTFLNNSIDQCTCIRTDHRGLMLEKRNIPIAIILVFCRHVARNNNSVFRCITSLVGSDMVSLFVINIDFLFACPDLKLLPQIFPCML